MVAAAWGVASVPPTLLIAALALASRLLLNTLVRVGLSEEGVGGLLVVALAHLDAAVLDDVGLRRVKQGTLQLGERVRRPLLKRHEGKAPAAAGLLVAHDGHVHDLAETLEVGADVLL